MQTNRIGGLSSSDARSAGFYTGTHFSTGKTRANPLLYYSTHILQQGWQLMTTVQRLINEPPSQPQGGQRCAVALGRGIPAT